MQQTDASTITCIATFDDRDDTRHAFDDLHRFGAQHRIPVAVTRDGRELLQAVRGADAELAIVCGWYWMIAPDARAATKRGFIGVHNSLLPRYRGAAPLVWAMLHGEREVGLSMYTLTDRMDDGDVWAQTSTPVGADDYVGDVLARLEEACAAMVGRAYPRILDGTLQPLPQDHARASYGTFRCREDGRIDWRQPSDAIYRAIRAQSRPYPGAFTTSGGRTLTIWTAHPFREPYYGRAGEVVRGPDGETLVVCGDDHAIALDDVAADGYDGDAMRELLRPRTILGLDDERHS